MHYLMGNDKPLKVLTLFDDFIRTNNSGNVDQNSMVLSQGRKRFFWPMCSANGSVGLLCKLHFLTTSLSSVSS